MPTVCNFSQCSCVERFFEKEGKKTRYSETEYSHLHDCLYTIKRNELIPKAEANVTQRYGFNMPGPRFTRLFAAEMDRLAHEMRLI